MLDRLPFCHICGAVHRAEFTVDMIHPVALEKHAAARDIRKCFFQNFCHFFGRQHQAGQNTTVKPSVLGNIDKNAR